MQDEYNDIIIKSKQKYKIRIYNFGKTEENFITEELSLHCKIKINEYDKDKHKFVVKDIINFRYRK